MSQRNFSISSDEGMMSMSDYEPKDGYIWHLGYCKYKWNSEQQKMVFYKQTNTRSMSTGLGGMSIDNNTTKEEIAEMMTGQGSVGCRDLRSIRVNGVAGVVTKDEETGKEYLKW